MRRIAIAWVALIALMLGSRPFALLFIARSTVVERLVRLGSYERRQILGR